MSKVKSNLHNITSENPIPNRVPLIDSLRLRIPRYKCSYIDPVLTEKYQKFYESVGLIDDDLNNAGAFVSSVKGITTRIFIKSYRKGEVSEDYVVCTVSCKMLRHRYFEGINKDTIDIIYDTLMGFKVFYCDKEVFMDAAVNDVDICFNTYIENDLLIESIHILAKSLKSTALKYWHPYTKSKNTNIGVEFNKREYATNAFPHVKIYNKELELLNKSAEFYNTFLFPLDIKNLVRIEVNVKHTKHRKYLQRKVPNLKYTNLRGLVDLDNETLMAVVLLGIPQYIEKIPQVKSISGLTPREIRLKYYIEQLINLGFDKDKLHGYEYDFPLTQKGHEQKSRLKKSTKEFIHRITVDQWTEIKLQQNGHIQEFLYKQLKLKL